MVWMLIRRKKEGRLPRIKDKEDKFAVRGTHRFRCNHLINKDMKPGTGRLRMPPGGRRRIAVMAAACLLAAPTLAMAQSYGTSSSGLGTGIGMGTLQSQQQGSTDCSDPLLAGTGLCNSQQTTGAAATYPGLSGAQGSSTQPWMGNYSDLQTFGGYGMRQPRPVKLPPQPLTEFQQFVAATTGEVLPIYGADLFDEVPSTFSPLDMAPVPSSYVIGPGDELRIRVWGQVNFSVDVRVDRTGEIYLPQVGEVHVAGLPVSDLDAHLRQAIGTVFKNFHLTADLGQIRAIQVYVTGQARRPGVYTVSSLSTLVDAIFASGGPSVAGSMRDIQLRRGGRTITDFDLYALLIHGNKSKDRALESGDVIFIPPAGPRVALTGSVRSPAIYELRPGETLQQAIADAGGATAVASETRVSIERMDDHRSRYAMQVNWDAAGLGTTLRDGDVVQLYSITPMYRRTVMLRGNTANPGRFAWHPGMRLSDLIPDRDSLVTRNYWWKRAQLGLPEPEFEPLPGLASLRQPAYPEPLSKAELEPARQENGESAPGQNGQAGNPAGSVNGNSAAPGSAAGATQAAAPNLPASQRAGSASVAAEYSAPAQQQTAEPRTEVGPVAPDIDWSYAVIERLNPETLKTELLPFDLGKLVMDHDESQNLALEPGDVVTIFSQADIRVPRAQETKFVRLEGEFVHAGVYTVQPGETLRELVRQAGGLTPDAYLYGSQFTRESTRALQQQRMDEYVQQLQMEMERSSLNMASAAALSPQALTGSATAQTTEQALISRLQAIRATGRIVLQFQPHSHGLAELPNIRLENGDRFIVPPMPASVNVVGSVYDQNSFLYEPGMRMGEYLRLAGGPNRDADMKHMFIIRADGSVVSFQAARTLWGNEFEALKMNPGDTIVVPEKTFKLSSIVGIMDWSQLFAQFALGAAAVKAVY